MANRNNHFCYLPEFTYQRKKILLNQHKAIDLLLCVSCIKFFFFFQCQHEHKKRAMAVKLRISLFVHKNITVTANTHETHLERLNKQSENQHALESSMCLLHLSLSQLFHGASKHRHRAYHPDMPE
jgi:hypothetical protein